MRIEALDSIDRVRTEDWRRLAGAQPEDSHEVHRALELSGLPGISFFCLQAIDAAGTVRGILPAYSYRGLPLEIAVEQEWIRGLVRGLRRGWSSLLRVDLLAAGNPVNETNRILLDPTLSPEGRGALAAELVGALEGLAARLDIGITVFKDFEPPDGVEMAGLGYHSCCSLPNNVLEGSWKSFEEYLGSLKHGHRRTIRRNLATARRSGLRVVCDPPASTDIDRLSALYRRTLDRAPIRFEELTPAYFRQTLAMCPAAGLIRAELDGTTIAFLLYLAGPGLFLVKRVGLDYERSSETRAYFVLFYRAIELAIERGVRRIVLGQQSYHSKHRWGAHLLPGRIFFRSRGAVMDRFLAFLLPCSFAPFNDHAALIRPRES